MKVIISLAAKHKETFSVMHIDVSRAFSNAPVEHQSGIDAGKIGLLKKMYGTRDAASNWERDWHEHVNSWVFSGSA